MTPVRLVPNWRVGYAAGMGRLVWLIPFVLAGCSTAPVAGLMDRIDGHHWERDGRGRDGPPPGVPPPPSVGIFEPAKKARNAEPPPDRSPADDADPYDVPVQPVRKKETPFEPKNKVKATPATRTRDADPRDESRRDEEDRPSSGRRPPPGRGDRVLAPPPLPPSDDRDDF